MHIERITVGILATRCYAVWQEGRDDCAVIDPGGEPEKIRRALGGRRIGAILLTHGHFDHMAAAEALMTDGCELIVHEADAPSLQDPMLNVSWLVRRTITAPAATRLVREGDVITAAGVDFRVLHTPGHTLGSVCYEAGDALFTGDTAFEGGGCGRTDLPGGSDADMRVSLARLMPLLRNHTMYSGH